MPTQRDDFSLATKNILRDRTGNRCSYSIGTRLRKSGIKPTKKPQFKPLRGAFCMFAQTSKPILKRDSSFLVLRKVFTNGSEHHHLIVYR